MKVIVIGLNPSAVSTVKKNSTLDRLNKWMDLLHITNYTFVNMIPEVGNPDKSKICDNTLQIAQKYDKILALGNMVSDELTSRGIKHFKMPHPSPRNRLLNDKSFEINMINRCEEYLYGC